jgi:hypothetical protein
MKNTITVRLPKGLSRDLEAMQKERKLPMSALVRDSLEKYVAINRFESLREEALPYAEKAGIVTDEDVFKTFKRK